MTDRTYLALFGSTTHAKVKVYRSTSKAFHWFNVRLWRVRLTAQIERRQQRGC